MTEPEVVPEQKNQQDRVVLKPGCLLTVGSWLGSAFLLFYSIIAFHLVLIKIEEHGRIIAGIVFTIILILPMFALGILMILVALSRGHVKLGPEGITRTRKELPWRPKTIEVLPWYRIHRMHIRSKRWHRGVLGSAKLIADDGSIYDSHMEWWEWSGDWTKALEIIKQNLPPESVVDQDSK